MVDTTKPVEVEQAPEASASATEQPQEAESSGSKPTETLEKAPIAPLRPLTRSLTGRASKPRVRDDSWYEPPKKAAGGRKKGKAATRKRTIDEVEHSESEEPRESPPAPAPEPEQTLPPLASTQSVFVDAFPPASSPGDSRAARSRANLPIPVPNLIKKSRGRRVPVRVGAVPPGEEEAKRLHVCRVEGCGKCFHRGEHLKRHIRSIHTHEKPFPCTFPSCNKFFNRHDNLLQHVKVHRNGDDLDAEGSPAPEDSRPGSPSNDGFGASAHAVGLAMQQQSTAITYPTPGAPMVYPSTTQQSYAAKMNMAVSSLRTELPESPEKGYEGYPLRAVGEQEEEEQEEGGSQDQGDQHYGQQHSATAAIQPAQHAEYALLDLANALVEHQANAQAELQAQAQAEMQAHGEMQQQVHGEMHTQEAHAEMHHQQAHVEMQQQLDNAHLDPQLYAPNGLVAFEHYPPHALGMQQQPQPQQQNPKSYYRIRTPQPPLPLTVPQDWQAQAQTTF